VPLTISVVTPCLNSSRFLEDAVRSVTYQDYPDWEHLIVDGGSTDGTLDILRRHPHLRWTSEPDAGQTAAINKGLRLATGQVVAYLCADDLYRPGAFRAVADAFRADPTIALLAGDCDVIDDAARASGRHRARLDCFDDLLHYWAWGRRFCLPQASVFLRRDLLDDVGFFDESFDLAMDYQMWLRVAARYPLTFLPRTLAAFRIGAQTKTARRRREMDREQFRASRPFWTFARGWRRFTIPIQASVHFLA